MSEMEEISKDLEVSLMNRETNEPDFYVDIELIRGDITKLEVDAIVNAAHEDLTGGGGVDGAIHKAAGQQLLGECLNLYGCKESEARITGAYNLPSKYVIHTVGPVWQSGMNENEIFAKKIKLRNCYHSCLGVASGQGLKSIAFPCISTGAYSFPKDIAAEVAVNAIKDYFKYPSYLKLVYIVCFDNSNFEEYKKLLS